MDRPTRQVLLVVAVLSLAAAGYWIWERFFSHGAQVDAMYAGCIAQFQAGKDQVKSGIDKDAAARPRDAPLSRTAKDLSVGLGKLIDEFAGNVGEAACGTLRDTCRLDFDDPACRNARERFADR